MRAPSAPGTASRRPARHVIGLLGDVEAGKTTLAVEMSSRAGDGPPEATSYASLTRSGIVVCEGRTLSVREARARLATPRRGYVLVDTPGHPGFLPIAVIALSLVDDVIVVVDGNRSVTPHTRTLLRAARGTGVRSVVSFVARPPEDGASEQRVDEEIRAAARAAGFAEDLPIVHGDVDALLRVLDALPDVSLDVAAPISVPIQRVYRPRVIDSLDQAVAVGRIARGTLRPGNLVELVGLTRRNGVRQVEEIQVFRERVDEAAAGDIVAVRIRNAHPHTGWANTDDKVVVERGKHLVAPGSANVSSVLSCTVDLVAAADGGRHTSFGSGFCAQFVIGAADITGRCELGRARAEPGTRVSMRAVLHEPTVVHEGTPFAILGQTSVPRGLVGIGWVEPARGDAGATQLYDD